MVIHKYCADTYVHRYFSVLNYLSFLDDGQANVFQKLLDELAFCHLVGEKATVPQINQQAVKCIGLIQRLCLISPSSHKSNVVCPKIGL